MFNTSLMPLPLAYLCLCILTLIIMYTYTDQRLLSLHTGKANTQLSVQTLNVFTTHMLGLVRCITVVAVIAQIFKIFTFPWWFICSRAGHCVALCCQHISKPTSSSIMSNSLASSHSCKWLLPAVISSLNAVFTQLSQSNNINYESDTKKAHVGAATAWITQAAKLLPGEIFLRIRLAKVNQLKKL